MGKKISAGAEKLAGKLFQSLIAAGWVKIPPGYKLVPIDAGPEQVAAAVGHEDCEWCNVDVCEIYRDMINAAPAVRFDGKV